MKEDLELFLSTAKQLQNGWVIYRMPGSGEIVFTSGRASTFTVGNELNQDTFIIAPFDQSVVKPVEISVSASFTTSDISILDHDYGGLTYYDLDIENQVATQAQYENLVSTILSRISDGNLKKAVPARAKNVPLPSGFLPIRFYKSLLTAYPDAFVYPLSTPQTGTWAGCSPEMLFRAEGNSISTLSLAGTKKNSSGLSGNPNEQFTGKETEEQEIVTDFIRDTLSRFCNDIQTFGPVLQKAGNVSHLATRFNGKLKPRFENQYGAVIKELHPTPAVCGLPVEEAKKLLLTEEHFNRKFYSGFLGPVGQSRADLYVNLRCMQLFEGSARLYAGAGIVPGSDPEKEWNETEEKMNTLLRFLI